METVLEEAVGGVGEAGMEVMGRVVARAVAAVVVEFLGWVEDAVGELVADCRTSCRHRFPCHLGKDRRHQVESRKPP